MFYALQCFSVESFTFSCNCPSSGIQQIWPNILISQHYPPTLNGCFISEGFCDISTREIVLFEFKVKKLILNGTLDSIVFVMFWHFSYKKIGRCLILKIQWLFWQFRVALDHRNRTTTNALCRVNKLGAKTKDLGSNLKFWGQNFPVMKGKAKFYCFTKEQSVLFNFL